MSKASHLNTAATRANNATKTDDTWRIFDQRGLIRDSLSMREMTVEEARSVFLDWCLGLPADQSYGAAANAVLKVLPQDAAPHPMLRLLEEASQSAPQRSKRKGGRAARQGKTEQ